MKEKKSKGFFSGLFYRGGQTDIVFLSLLIFMLGVGLVCLWSASYAVSLNQKGTGYSIALKQALYVLLGLGIMFAVSHFDYSKLNNKYVVYGLLLLSFALLIASLLSHGDGNGIRRWIYIGSMQFQPSEITKCAFILFFSYVIDKYYVHIKKKRHGKKGFFQGLAISYIPFFVPLILTCILLYKQPHLSCMVLLAGLTFMMMFVGGVHPLLLGVPMVLAVVAFVILASTGYFAERISLWLDPFSHRQDGGWQMIQSLFAIGSGGFLGVGFTNSRLKYLYLPEPENDFIFPIICEELGFLGALFIITLFVLFVCCGLRIAMRAKDKFGSMIVFGTTMQIGLQALVNMSVVTGIFPNTGISLPFFSSGGTAVVVLLAQIGLVLSVARKSSVKKLG